MASYFETEASGNTEMAYYGISHFTDAGLM